MIMRSCRKFQWRFKRALSAGLLTGLWVGLCLVAGAPGASAQTLTQDRTLTFGRFIMNNNSTQRDLVLNSNGSYTADPAYIFYAQEPVLGRYIINNQTPNAVMDVTFDLGLTSVAPLGGGGPRFTLVNPYTVPAVVTTDGGGNATFEVGATLRSDGLGGVFPSDTYAGEFSITVTPQ
jgi:hypothetical protein